MIDRIREVKESKGIEVKIMLRWKDSEKGMEEENNIGKGMLVFRREGRR